MHRTCVLAVMVSVSFALGACTDTLKAPADGPGRPGDTAGRLREAGCREAGCATGDASAARDAAPVTGDRPLAAKDKRPLAKDQPAAGKDACTSPPLTMACKVAPLAMSGSRTVNVTSESQLQTAVSNLQAGDTILLAAGTYTLSQTLYVNGKDNVTIRGASGCDAVVLVGKGMDNPSYGNVEFGIWTNAKNTTIAHLTIRDTWDNPIILNGGAQSPHIYSVKLQNAGSQFIKSNPTSAAPPPAGAGNDNGVVEYSWFEYLAGPPASSSHAGGAGYTNGLSLHTVKNWVIRGNLFKSFHTPDSSSYAWNPAVLVWNYSSGTLTERNVFLNVDRAVAYGLGERSPGFDHQGGTIRNNFVTYQAGLMSASRTASSDGAIIVWDSPGTRVYHNTVLTNGNVTHAIELRFAETTGGEVRNNLCDASINLRDSATAAQGGNLLSATPALFAAPAAGDLHLRSTATAAVDKAPALPAVTDDLDGNSRPQGCCYDLGADEVAPGSCL